MHRILPCTTACFVLVGVLFVSRSLYSIPVVSVASSDELQLPLSEIVSRMMAYRQWQDGALREYQARRRFHATTQRFNMDSTMEVQTIFHWPYSLQSTVIKEEGSGFVREHVFEKILAAETELAANDEADVIPKNYDFTVIGKDNCDGRRCWHLTIKPKRKDKFLLDGEAWVDAADFAISRVHGFPAKHLSFWVPNAEIDRRLRRIEGIWLTERFESSSDVRVAGSFKMLIEYTYDNVKVVKAGGNGHPAGGSLSE